MGHHFYGKSLTLGLYFYPQEQQALGTTFSGGMLKSQRGGDPGWILFEFNQVKERIGQIERKSEALWHSQVHLGQIIFEFKRILGCYVCPLISADVTLSIYFSQENDQEILGLVDRLKKDVDMVRHDLEATQASFRASQLTVNKLEEASSSAAADTQVHYCG